MLTVPIGVILASAFPAIVVYAQELLPGRTARWPACSSDSRSAWAASGRRCWAGWPTLIGIDFVYRICAFLPLFGLLAALLPDVERELPAGRPSREPATGVAS